MRVVLDANVLVAAFATQGLFHAVFELCVDQHEIVVSTAILDEAARALVTKLKVPTSVVDSIRQYLKDQAQVHSVQKPITRVARDPSDDHVLALALETKADYLITGDQDLLVLKRHGDTMIVQPREFWELLRTRIRNTDK